MFKRLLSIVLLVAAMSPAAVPARTRHPAPTSSAAPQSASLHEYESQSAAQAHCPSDTVVWLNTNSGIWHEKGMRWYGATRQGAYVCRREASAAGDRDTRNGQ